MELGPSAHAEGDGAQSDPDNSKQRLKKKRKEKDKKEVDKKDREKEREKEGKEKDKELWRERERERERERDGEEEDPSRRKPAVFKMKARQSKSKDVLKGRSKCPAEGKKEDKQMKTSRSPRNERRCSPPPNGSLSPTFASPPTFSSLANSASNTFSSRPSASATQLASPTMSPRGGSRAALSAVRQNSSLENSDSTGDTDDSCSGRGMRSPIRSPARIPRSNSGTFADLPCSSNSVTAYGEEQGNLPFKPRLGGDSFDYGRVKDENLLSWSDGAPRKTGGSETKRVKSGEATDTIEDNDISKGFLDYFHSGKFSDLTLVAGDGRKYRVHRLIIAYSSEYFHNLLLQKEFKMMQELQLDISDPHDVFAEVLNYMYQGEVVINSDNSIPLLALADKLEMKDLKTRTSQYIAANIRRENCISMFKRAFEFDAKEVIDKCTAVIARNFCFLHADFTFLPSSIYLKILQHDDLAVKNECDLFKGLQEYVLSHKDLPKEHVEEMVRQIRFVHFSMEQMHEFVFGNPIVPPDMIIEALAAKVERLEQGDSKDVKENPRLRERKRYGLTFEYSSKTNGVGVNGNGVITWIATNCGTTGWENPTIGKKVRITVSSEEKGDPSVLLDSEEAELWTKDVPSSWFCIDLGEGRKVTPTYYTLRHGGNYKGDSLRHWDLQGSLDGENWVVLSRHNNDASLNSPFAVHSWPVILPLDIKVNNFRYFRILQTGHNSSNHNFLMLSGFEIYGELFET